MSSVPQILIDEFLEKERNAPRLLRISLLKESFKPTSSLKENILVNKHKQKVFIKPNFVMIALIIGLIIFALGLIYQFFAGFRAGAIPFVVLLVMVPAPLFFVYFGLFHGTIFKIELNRNGIALKGNSYPWHSIQDTFIYKTPAGRMYARYLVIVTKDNMFHKVNLYLFETSDTKLSTYIEYFKSQHSLL